MSAPRFFCNPLITGAGELAGPEADHALRSRRLSVGDELILFDGAGREAVAKIARAGKSRLWFEVEALRERPRQRPGLTLAVAMPKGPRQDWLIEKCTELGVERIHPLSTARSVAGASEHKLEKWRRSAIEAAKQSRQAWLPEFGDLKDLAATLASRQEYTHVVAGIPGPTRPMAALLAELPGDARLLGLVGPEGGWSPEEIGLLTAAGVEAVSLGPNILRIETAAVALAALVHALQRGSCASGDLPSNRGTAGD